MEKETFTPIKLFLVLFFALVASSLTVTGIYLGFTAYTAKIAAEELKKEQARINELAALQRQAHRDQLAKERALRALEKAKREEARAIEAKKRAHQAKLKADQIVKDKAIAQQLRETCSFWKSAYLKERTEYARLMMKEACDQLK